MNPDKEMERLIAAYLDGTLDEEDRDAFERCLRDNPDALRQTAEAVRFEAQLADALQSDHMELVQQRRVLIDRVSGQPILVESTQRVGRPWIPGSSLPDSKSRLRLLVIPLAIALVAVGIWLSWNGWQRGGNGGTTANWKVLPLKNHGFESPDLGVPPASSTALPDWQDKFSTSNATLLALSPGLAHEGRQVARLASGGHIKQLLYDDSGQPVVFEPGRRLRVSGWVNAEVPVEANADIFHLALHYVNDHLKQYVVCYRVSSLDGSGWRRFSVELFVPEQEVFEPSYTSDSNLVATVTGRQILLSITNISSGARTPVPFLLDDLSVEVMEDTKK